MLELLLFGDKLLWKRRYYLDRHPDEALGRHPKPTAEIHWRKSPYVAIGCLHSRNSSSPPRLSVPEIRGQRVKGERRGCGLPLSPVEELVSAAPSDQPHGLVWGEEGASSSAPPEHLAAPRTLIWRENKNVFISQERRRTLE